MKNNLFIYLAFVTLAIAGMVTVFTACNKDEQGTNPATINPLKDIPVGTTYTFYGQTEKNIVQQEVCRMQLTLGENGEWTVKRDVIPNNRFKSAVEMNMLTTLNIPEKYISHPDEHTVRFDFPVDEDIKYYFIPFETNNYKAAYLQPETTYVYSCWCLYSKNGETYGTQKSCKKVVASNAAGWNCDDNGCSSSYGGSCLLSREAIISTPISPAEPQPIAGLGCSFTPGVLVPATSLTNK